MYETDFGGQISLEINFHDKRIYSQLNSDMKAMEAFYPMENIGGAYYDEKDEKTYIFIVPTFENFVECGELINKEVVVHNKTYYLRDIRISLRGVSTGHNEFLDSLSSKYVLINPMYNHIYNTKVNRYYEQIKTSAYLDAPCEALTEAVKDMIRVCLLNRSPLVAFLKQLTDIEKTGLKELVECIGEEGVFSQSNLASKIGMSRLGMTNLIAKLEEFDMAEIQRLGRGGTYCRFKNYAILDITGFSSMQFRGKEKEK